MKPIIAQLKRAVGLGLLLGRLFFIFLIGMLVGVLTVAHLDAQWILAISAVGTFLFTMTIAICTYYYAVTTEHLWKTTQFSILMQKKGDKSPDWWGWYDRERQRIKEEVHDAIAKAGGSDAKDRYSKLENDQFRHRKLSLFFENDPVWQSDVREQVKFMRSVGVEPKDVPSLKDLVEHYHL